MSRLLINFVFVAFANHPVMANPEIPNKALFSSMSLGSSRSHTPQFERVFEEAHAKATLEGDAVFTVERLLQRLVDEPEVESALATESVDVRALSIELTTHLREVRKTEEGFSMVMDSKVREV